MCSRCDTNSTSGSMMIRWFGETFRGFAPTAKLFRPLRGEVARAVDRFQASDHRQASGRKSGTQNARPGRKRDAGCFQFASRCNYCTLMWLTSRSMRPGRSGRWNRRQALDHRRQESEDLGRKMAPLGRLRTQAIWVLRPKVKYCHSKTLGAVFSGLGRLGRKIPEHLVVASGQ